MVFVMAEPASITATGGMIQTTSINTAFAENLQATVLDSANVPVPNANVTFNAPLSGQSGTFGAPCSGSTCVVSTNSLGIAIAPTFTANGTTGSYDVKATVPLIGAIPGAATFKLTNELPLPIFTKTITTPPYHFSGGSFFTFTISNPNTLH